ncbi:unnamed protein product, partial [marine sediment metagenome]
DIPDLLKELQDNNLILCYDTPKTTAIQMLDWWDANQKMQWAWPSEYSPPEGWQDHLRYKLTAKEVFTLSWPPTPQGVLFKPVYFILDKESEAVKIGVADSPEARLNSLQAATPHKLTLIKVIEGGSLKLEKELHQMFAESSLNNEWFRITPKLQSYLESSPEASPESSPEASPETAPFLPLTTPIKQTKTIKRTIRGRGNSPEPSGEKPSPSLTTSSLFQSLTDSFYKAWSRMPNSRETAQLRDLEKEISSAGGATAEQVYAAFKEASVHNKLHISYVRAI